MTWGRQIRQGIPEHFLRENQPDSMALGLFDENWVLPPFNLDDTHKLPTICCNGESDELMKANLE